MKNIVSKIEKVQVGAGVVFLTIFLVTVLAQIFTRYLKIAAVWTEDVAMYSFIWAVFMGASAMVNQNMHFAFTFLGDKLQGNSKEILHIIVKLLMSVFTILMVVLGLNIVKTFWNYNWITIPSFKMGYTWMCVPIAGFTMTLYLANQIIEHISNIRSNKKMANNLRNKEVI